MTTYYVDPTASGDNDGSSEANAWESVQRAVDGADGTQPVSGDIVLCKHTGVVGAVDETISTSIDVDGNSGSVSTGYIKFLGTNSSWVVDGTKYVIDANSSAARCFIILSPYQWLENFEGKNATGDGIFLSATGDGSVLLNCEFHNNTESGIQITTNCLNARLILCSGHDNTGSGLDVNGRFMAIMCSFYNNTGNGVDGGTAANISYLYGCLCHNNTTFGIADIDSQVIIANCVIDGEGVGIDIDDNDCMIIGNRITNCTAGIDFNTKNTLVCWNHFYNNSSSDVADATLAYNIPYNEALTNDVMSSGIDGTNTVDTGSDDGYENRANDDFNLKSDAENRRIEVDLEVGS